jgi:hypothetical protein
LFAWGKSPQGDAFWDEIDDRIEAQKSSKKEPAKAVYEHDEFLEIVEKLKKTCIPFGLLSEKEQEVLQEAGRENCISLDWDTEYSKPYWSNLDSLAGFWFLTVYRIKENYVWKREIETFKCKMTVQEKYTPVDVVRNADGVIIDVLCVSVDDVEEYFKQHKEEKNE